MSKAIKTMREILDNIRNSNIDSEKLKDFVCNFSGVYVLQRASKASKMLFEREFQLACYSAVKFEGCELNEVLKLKEVSK